MQITVNGTQIHYSRHLGEKKVVLLHGWGGSRLSMQGIYEFLGKLGCDVINVDLPGFGSSPPPPASFGIDDYTQCISEMLQRLDFKNATIIGHSFGGRIAILLATQKCVKNIILVSSAGIKPRFSLKKWIKKRKYKRAKRLGKDISGFGSPDYRSLNPDMRAVFVRVVNRHLDNELHKIEVPTLLIWGKKDDQTPLYMAKKICKNVKDSGLVVLEGNHFAYTQRHAEFCTITANFLGLK